MTPKPKGAAAVLLTELERLEPLETQWRALAIERENPQMTPDFYRAWVENYGGQVQPYVTALLDGDGNLRGLLPFAITNDRLRHVQLAGTASFWMHAEPVARHGEESEVAVAAARLLAERDEWSVLTLDNVDVGAPWTKEFAETLRELHGRKLREDSTEEAWLLVDTSAGWDAYLAARSASFRQKLRSLERKVEGTHEISIRVPATRADVDRDLEALFRLHHARREQLAAGSTFDDPAMRGTLEQFARAGLDQGWTRIRVLEVDGEFGAGNLCFRIGDRSVGYLFGWDPKWEREGLGRIAMVDSLRAAADEGVREFDLSVGWSDFKGRHATTERRVQSIWLYPRRTALVFALRKAARKALPTSVRRVLGRRLRSGAGRVDMPD